MMSKALEVSLLVRSQEPEERTSSKEYVNEWESLFVGQEVLNRIKFKAGKGDLKSCNFRSICWKLLLGCLPEDSNLWIESTKSQRQYYEEILDKVSFDPRYVASQDDLAVNNPLSLAQENPWNQYFKDKDLKKTIQQDVIRTFPEIKFFQSKDIQKLMISILFSYAQQRPHLSYRQGMHELLAPIIYVLSFDNKQYLAAAEKEDLDMKIHFLLNQNYIEHDAFSIFSKLMQAVEPWYSINISPNSKMAYFDNSNYLAVKLKAIHEDLLKKFDLPLYAHLEKMEIIPQIYGIRWLRLLFGREFPINEVLDLWDAIFCENETFELVDYICVAMLISIRDLLFPADYSTCLRYLMRYPNSIKLRSILNLAYTLRKADLNEGGESVDTFRIPAVLKEANKPIPKNTYPGVAKPVKAVSSVKYQESRPKSLSLTSSLWGYGSCSTTEVAGGSKDDGPSSQKEARDYMLAWKPNTLPRARIQDVMEKRVDSRDACLAIENLADRTMADKRAVGVRLPKVSSREMLPLSVSSQQALMQQGMDTLLIEVNKLDSKVSELRSLNEYCSEQLTLSIEQLENCLEGQNLMYEEEVMNSLGDLKRVRDCLKESCEVSSDEPPEASCSFSDEAVETRTDAQRPSKASIHETLSRKLKENLLS